MVKFINIAGVTLIKTCNLIEISLTLENSLRFLYSDTEKITVIECPSSVDNVKELERINKLLNYVDNIEDVPLEVEAPKFSVFRW